MAAEAEGYADPHLALLALLTGFRDADGFVDDYENTILVYLSNALIDIYVRPPVVRVTALMLDPLGVPDVEDFGDSSEWRDAVMTRTRQSGTSTDDEVFAWVDSHSDHEYVPGAMYLGPGGPRRFAPAITFEGPVDAAAPDFIRDHVTEFARAWAARSTLLTPTKIGRTA